jgi:hypothetical protein
MTIRNTWLYRSSIGAAALVIGLSVCASTAGASTPSVAPPATAAQVTALVAAAPSLKSVPSNAAPSLSDAANDTGLSMAINHGCVGYYGQTSISLKKCTFGDVTGTRTLVALGDSHAAMWLPALNLIGAAHKWKVILLWKGDCGSADLSYWLPPQNRAYPECGKWHKWATSEINKLDPKVVFLGSDVQAISGIGGQAAGHFAPSVWQGGISKTLKELTSAGTTKVVMGDIPVLYNDAGGATICLAAHETNVQACSAPASKAVLTTYATADQQAASKAGAQFIDIAPWFCTSVCTGLIGKYVVYSDSAHVTATYAKYLSGVLYGDLKAGMGS